MEQNKFVPFPVLFHRNVFYLSRFRVCNKFISAIFTPPHGAPKNLFNGCSKHCSAGR